MKVTKAVIPAAGLGTRFLPATKAQPKEMLPIVDKPTIQYIVEEAVQAGITDILIVTGKHKRAIEDHFDHAFHLESILHERKKQDLLKQIEGLSSIANIHYIRQSEPLGLGHAVSLAKSFVGKEPFAVLLGDDIIRNEVPGLKQLLEVHQTTGGSVLGVQTVPYEHTNRYGIVAGDSIESGLYRVHHLVEKPQENPPSQLAIIGRYVLNHEIFKCLEQSVPGAGGELQLTDAISALGTSQPVYALEIQGERYDIGDKIGYLRANIEFALARTDLRDALKAYLKTLNDDQS